MNRMIGALVLSFGLVVLLGKWFIPQLIRHKYGQPINELGPKSHQSKQDTPTMGGLMIAATLVVVCLVLHPKGWFGTADFMGALLTVSLLSMLVGWLDDYLKVSKHNSKGLSPKGKIIGQTIIAAGFSCYCYFHPMVGSTVYIPFLNILWDMGILYIPAMTLLIIFMVNSANLQDGLDGLLSGVSCVGFSAWGVMALVFLMLASLLNDPMVNNNYYAIGVFSMAMAGSTMGFLRYNMHPAKVFMGDTGSMLIGGATVGCALLLRQPFMLLMISFTMVISSLSVIIQRTYYKLTHGKRIFLNSPLHHHFEAKHYTETQIGTMYAVCTGILSLIAILSLNGLQNMH